MKSVLGTSQRTYGIHFSILVTLMWNKIKTKIKLTKKITASDWGKVQDNFAKKFRSVFYTDVPLQRFQISWLFIQINPYKMAQWKRCLHNPTDTQRFLDDLDSDFSSFQKFRFRFGTTFFNSCSKMTRKSEFMQNRHFLDWNTMNHIKSSTYVSHFFFLFNMIEQPF